jgi:hypothetical protein
MLSRSDARAGGFLYVSRLAEFFGKPFKQHAVRSSADCLNPLTLPEKMF